MKIALIGFEFESSNKGCEALSYSFMPFLQRIIKEPIEIVNINIHESLGLIPSIYPDIKFSNIHVKLKDISCWFKIYKELKKCDIIFDITHGDSFSDIYGKKWYFQTTLIKQIAIWSKKPLILLPQTYGPYKNNIAKKWAISIMKKSYKIYSRDRISTDYVKSIIDAKYHEKIKTFTDLAFSLPYHKDEISENKNVIKIGLNISGLLWNDCLKHGNLNLKVNYCEYCFKLIEKLLFENKYEIYLIPHVICDIREGEDYFENDCYAAKKVLEKYPECKYNDNFETAIDVKSYISNLDVLVAPRMHASIAAFSTGVACIPFAYSRKFKGIYNALNYDFIIDGNALSTEEAINKTMSYIHNMEKLKEKAKDGMKIVNDDLIRFEDELKNVIDKLRKGEKMFGGGVELIKNYQEYLEDH